MTIKIVFNTQQRVQIEQGYAPSPAGKNPSRVQASACGKILTSLSDAKKKIASAIPVFPPAIALRQEVEKARFEKLATALHLQLSGPHLGTLLPEGAASEIFSPKETLIASALSYRDMYRQPVEEWVQSVAALASKIKDVKDVKLGTVDAIRHEMNNLMGSVYESLIDTDHPAVNFLQILSIKLHAADGEPHLSAYARKVGVSAKTDSFAELADAIKGKLKQNPPVSHNQDGKMSRVWWILNHPKRFLHSMQSEFSPMTYNPNHSNPSYLGPRLERTVDGQTKTLQAYYGPSPTGDRVYEFGVLPGYKKFGLFEIYFNYQDASHGSEKKRIDEIGRIAAKTENRDCLKHVVLGFDAKIAHPQMKSLIHSYKTVEEFVEGYSNFVVNGARDLKTKTGFAIPQEVLNDEQLKGIFTSAQTFFTAMGVPEMVKDPKANKKDLAEMMIMDIDARIAAAILYQAFEKMPAQRPDLDKDLSSCYVSARCKQHIDRGAVQSNALRIYFRMFENDSPLTQKEFEEISGGILGRAPNVDDRNILFRRYKRFDSLMRLIGSRQAELAQSLRTYRDQHLKK